MKTAYALKISEKILPGLHHYGYANKVPDDITINNYLVMGSGGPYVVDAGWFEEEYEFVDKGATIDLINLTDFGATKDERTLNPFMPRDLNEEYWNSFTMRLFSDSYGTYQALFHGEIKAGPRVENQVG